MSWALLDGLRTDDPAKGLQALDLVFAYFQQRGSLTKLFKRLNRTHFDGALPRYRVQREPVAPSSRGPEGVLDAGHCWSERRLIIIGYGLSPSQERRTLLHEMAHAATTKNKPAHGEAFQQELLRLARLGERWARHEAVGFEQDGDAHCSRWIPRTAEHVLKLWEKHWSAWRRREEAKRSRAAQKAALTRKARRRGFRTTQQWLLQQASTRFDGSG